jgi:hypothetical protein
LLPLFDRDFLEVALLQRSNLNMTLGMDLADILRRDGYVLHMRAGNQNLVVLFVVFLLMHVASRTTQRNQRENNGVDG